MKSHNCVTHGVLRTTDYLLVPNNEEGKHFYVTGQGQYSLYKSSKVNQQILAVLRENLMGLVYKR